MRTRAALLTALCLGIISLSGPVASAAASTQVTPAATTSCDTSDLALSTPSSGEDTTVYSTGTRAITRSPCATPARSTARTAGSSCCSCRVPSTKPEPTLEWRIGGGSWHGTSLSRDNGVVNGNASCASPCWKAGIVTLDVPAHTAYTIDLAVIFHSGLNHGFFSGAVYYTGQAITDDGASGALIAWGLHQPSGKHGRKRRLRQRRQHASAQPVRGGQLTDRRTVALPRGQPQDEREPDPEPHDDHRHPDADADGDGDGEHPVPRHARGHAEPRPRRRYPLGRLRPSTALAATGIVILALAAGAGYRWKKRRQ